MDRALATALTKVTANDRKMLLNIAKQFGTARALECLEEAVHDPAKLRSLLGENDYDHRNLNERIRYSDAVRRAEIKSMLYTQSFSLLSLFLTLLAVCRLRCVRFDDLQLPRQSRIQRSFRDYLGFCV